MVYDKLYFYKHFNTTFKKIYHLLQIVHGLYWVARQCHQFYAPKCRPKQTTQGSSLQLIQTMPPADECIPVFQTRLILIHLTEPSPILAPSTPQPPAPQQDRAMEEFGAETLSEPLIPIEETSISQVQPLLGTTHRENLLL